MTILPYPEMPTMISYHCIAFPLGIIQANSSEDITKWLCTKCIKCAYYSDEAKKFDLEAWDDWGAKGLTTY